MDIVARKFGVTAAMGLFVEVAVPTVMFLYCKHVKRLKETLYKDGSFWDTVIIEELGNKYDWNINRLLGEFPENQLYIHPIKLSKWWKKV